MKIVKVDFLSEIEWLHIDDTLYVDCAFRSGNYLPISTSNEIRNLGNYFQNQPINKKKQLYQLKELLRRLRGKYEQLYISNLEGNYFNADGQCNNIRDRFYFSQVLRGNTVVSSKIINRSTKKPVIAVATPIRYGTNIIGLFGATILISPVFKGFGQFSLISNNSLPNKHNKKNFLEGADGIQAQALSA